ncbi:trypsin-like serine peptidase [Zhongshania aliphaticivorans]|uniref:trypsin-like serine peptidase n=1 Tax=Zhongshania aliphaticivorans TaxID=1470434 RepID=UPI00133005A1|nr:trypsin-like serine protease [Zhongshania aliphaticivorans]
MHNFQLNSLLNSSGLAAVRTARNVVVCWFLLFSSLVSADCGGGLFPAPSSELLFPRSKFPVPSLQEPPSPECKYGNIDLAQWHFWGVAPVVADIEKAYYYALKTVLNDRWPYDLALLHAAFVIKGLDRSFSVSEAVRRFNREITSASPLRRDKALAVLNQLSEFSPRLTTVEGEVFADVGLSQAVVIKPSPALQMSTKGDKRQILVTDHDGVPNIYWTKTRSAEAPKQNSMIFQRYPISGANGVKDTRQQIWRAPSDMPVSGVLLSRLIRADGSPYESNCTATLIAPQWLISASHCLFTPEGSDRVASVNFIPYSEAQVGADPQKIAVAGVWRHKDHSATDQYNGEVGRYSGSDIAIFKLKKPLNLAVVPVLATPHSANSWVDSLAYPNDKPANTLWASRCRGNLWLKGGGQLSDLYTLDCFSYAGQSGAAITQNNAGKQQIIGVLSSRVYNESINQPIFAALNSRLISNIQTLLAGRSTGLFVAMPILPSASLAEASP